MLLSPRHLRFVLRGMLAFAVLLGVLLLGVGFWLRQNPQALALRIADALRERTGLECSMSMVDVVMLPVPALALADMRLTGPRGEFSVAYATMRPSLPALLTGSFEPGEVTLLRPELRLRLPSLPGLPSSGQTDAGSSLPSLSAPPPLPKALSGCRLTVLHGSVELRADDGQSLLLEDIRSALRVHAPDTVKGRLSCGTAGLYRENILLGALDALHLELDGAASGFARGAPVAARLKTRLHVPSLLRAAGVDLEFTQTPGDDTQPRRALRADIAGTLALDGQPVPFFLRGTADTGDNSALLVRALHAGLGEDSLTLNARLTTSGETPRLTGNVDVRRLSLPRWFGFARRLPAGLQRTLDALSGTLSFEATRTGLTVSRLTATASGMTFSGAGGVEHWARPVVLLDLATDAADLDTAFPEAAGQSVAPLQFFHRPLTPVPGVSGAERLPVPDIDYDIRLRATTLTWRGLAVAGCSFSCRPDANDDARMTLRVSDLYGGKGEAVMVLGGDTATPSTYAIKAHLNNVALDQPVARLMGRGALGGRLSGGVDLRSRGDSAAAFLNALEGTASLRLENGFLTSSPDQGGKRRRFAFTLLELSAQADGRSPEARAANTAGSCTYAGTWQGSLRAPGISATARLNGPVSFSRKGPPLHLKKLSGNVRLDLDRAACGLQEGLKAEIAGIFSFNAADNALAVENARAIGGGLEIEGGATARFSPRGPELKGRLRAKTADLRRLLARFDMTPPSSIPGDMLRVAEMAGDIELDAASLSLKDLRGGVDATRLKGRLEGTWKNRPAWKFDLEADALDLDRYRTPAPSGKPDGSLTLPKRWDMTALRSFDLRGSLRCGTLHVRKLAFQDVHLPVRLNRGTLECAPVRSTLYGAQTISSFRGEAGDGLKINADMSASGVDMLRLTEEQGLKTVMAGRGALQARVRGSLRSAADAPAALDGSWTFSVREGFLQSRSPRGRLTGSRTVFALTRASGSLEKGVLRSGDIFMEGSNLRVAGAGWINLAAQTLDVTLRVNVYKIPEFPLRFYGNLTAPQSSVQAGRAIVDTLGNLGTGMLDAVGHALDGALRMFRR